MICGMSDFLNIGETKNQSCAHSIIDSSGAGNKKISSLNSSAEPCCAPEKKMAQFCATR